MSADTKRSIGGLWMNEAKSGKKYMSGSVEIKGEKVKIIVFKNDRNREEGDKKPDYKIYEHTPRPTQNPDAPLRRREEDDCPF